LHVAQRAALEMDVADRLLSLIHDPVPMTRAAAVYALGNLLCRFDDGSPHERAINVSKIGIALIALAEDGR
jgi:hypothetical protein